MFTLQLRHDLSHFLINTIESVTIDCSREDSSCARTTKNSLLVLLPNLQVFSWAIFITLLISKKKREKKRTI